MIGPEPEIAVTISAWNRPAYLWDCLASIRAQIGPALRVFLHVDGEGGKEDEILSVAQQFSIGGMLIRFESERLGVNRSTKATIDWAWKAGYDWALYLEDDLVLSPDAFALTHWYAANTEYLADTCGGYIGAYCLCRMIQEQDRAEADRRPDAVLYARAFSGWGFLVSRAQYKLIEPAWLSGEKDDPPSMWDRHVGRRIRNLGDDNYNCMPALSRVTNIGEFGYHFTPERHRKWMEGHQWNTNSAQHRFRVGGWTADAIRHREGVTSVPTTNNDH